MRIQIQRSESSGRGVRTKRADFDQITCVVDVEEEMKIREGGKTGDKSRIGYTREISRRKRREHAQQRLSMSIFARARQFRGVENLFANSRCTGAHRRDEEARTLRL